MRRSDRADMGPEANDHTWCLPRDNRTCCQARLLRWSSSCKPRMGVAFVMFVIVLLGLGFVKWVPEDVIQVMTGAVPEKGLEVKWKVRSL